MKMKNAKTKRFFVTTICMLMLIAIVCAVNIPFSFNDTDYIVTVTDKDRIVENSKDKSSSKYMVFADDEDGNALVFENTDCFIRFKFNSSNIQGQLKEGHTYEITVIGYRVPFFSWYQNIIKAVEITE